MTRGGAGANDGDGGVPHVRRRDYVRSLGAVGTGGLVGAGAGAAGDAAAQSGSPPREPYGVHVRELGEAEITVGWYHTGGDADHGTPTSYEVVHGGTVATTVEAPSLAAGPYGRSPLLTATVDGLDPGTAQAISVRAVGPRDERSPAVTLETATVEPSLVGRFGIERTGETDYRPANWATAATTDRERREVRIRGGHANGGCAIGTVHEIRYDEDADRLRVVVDAPPNGRADCPSGERELRYEVTAVLARTPQEIVVEHRGTDWRRSSLVHATDPSGPLTVTSDEPNGLVDDVLAATLSLNDVPSGDAIDVDVRAVLDDPSVGEITDASSSVLPEDGPTIADDGASLTWSATGVDPASIRSEDGELLSVYVEGADVGECSVRASVDAGGGDRPVAKAVSRRPFSFDEVFERYPVRGSGVFAADRSTDAIQVAWLYFGRYRDDLTVSVDGEVVERLAPEEVTDVRPAWERTYEGTTIEGLEPDTEYEIEVAVAGSSQRVGGTLSTLPTGVTESEFATTRWDELDGVRPIDRWGDIAVSDDRTRVDVAGEFSFGSTPASVWLESIDLTDGTLTLSVSAVGNGGDEQVELVGYECGVELAEPVDRVVLRYAGVEETWDATAGGAFERFGREFADDAVATGEDTTVDLSLDGVPDTRTEYYLLVRSTDPSVARIVDVTIPDWIHEESNEDRFTGRASVDPDRHDPTEPIDLGTLTVRGESTGTASLAYHVVPARNDSWGDAMGGRLEPTLTVTEGGTSTAGPRPVGSNTAVPRDPDDDGLYEDVNGNARRDIADAVDLFRNRESVDAQYFDFTESGGVSIGDAVSLFRENSG